MCCVGAGFGAGLCWGGSDTTVPCTLFSPTVVYTVDLGTCNCFEMAPSDFPDLFKSIMCSFRSMLTSVDFTIVVFMPESISDSPIKVGPEK